MKVPRVLSITLEHPRGLRVFGENQTELPSNQAKRLEMTAGSEYAALKKQGFLASAIGVFTVRRLTSADRSLVMVPTHAKAPAGVPSQAYSYNLTLNNPQDHYEWAKGFNPDTATEEEFRALMQRALRPFTSSGKRKRLQEDNGAMVGCEKGDTFHMHIYLFSKNKLKFDQVKKQYDGAHIEKTRGTAEECWDYLVKDPDGKHSDKVGTKLAEPIRWGECFKTGAESRKKESQKDIWGEIDELIESGLKPNEITLKGIKYTARSETIKQRYQEKKQAEMPDNMDRENVYHFGATGSGKTYAAYDARLDTCPDIIMLVASRNSFDDYVQQEHVVLEELRGDNNRINVRTSWDRMGREHEEIIHGSPDISYSLLLKLLDRNNLLLDTRYHNTYWCPKTIHITSPYAPEDLYNQFSNIKSAWELIRRFTKIVYHYVENGEYKEFALTPWQYMFEVEWVADSKGEYRPWVGYSRIMAKFGRFKSIPEVQDPFAIIPYRSPKEVLLGIKR